jgi:glycosyltransferase involved in cell wall biosynthesis
MFTVVLPTSNEESRIEFALRNFHKKHEIFVLDNYSSDRSMDLARKYTDHILQYKNPGYLTLECYDLIFKSVPTDYLLIAFAGQYYTPELLECYEQVALGKKYKAVAAYMRTYSYGVPVNTYAKVYRNPQGSFSFFDKRSINLEKGKIHDELPFVGSVDDIYYPPKEKKYCIVTFRDDTASVMEEKHNRYANFDARQRYDRGARSSLLKMLYKSLKELFVCLLWRGAAMQGPSGVINSIYRAFYFFSVEVRIWEIQEGFTPKEVKLRHQQIREEFLKRNELPNSRIVG